MRVETTGAGAEVGDIVNHGHRILMVTHSGGLSSSVSSPGT